MATVTQRRVRIGSVEVGGGAPLVVIAGPCAIESFASAMRHARALKIIFERVGMPWIFKSSYDKANRSSVESFRGLGMAKGLEALRRIKKELEVPVLTDVHVPTDVARVAEVADCLQIPAFLCRQTDLLVSAARTKRAVNVKKGQFLAPWDMEQVVRKIESAGNRNILLTERGTMFGYNNLVVDFRGLGVMRGLGYPVVFDATHSVQLPGGLGHASGGQRQYVEGLSRAAVAFGCDAVFLEVHEDPNRAPCDGPNMLALSRLEAFLGRLKRLVSVVRNQEV